MTQPYRPMRLLRSEQRSPAAADGGQYPSARVGHGPHADSATQQVDPRVARASASAHLGRLSPADPSTRAGMPVLPRPRPDEVPAPPLPEHAGPAPDPRGGAHPGQRTAPA
ncbi:MAG: hypothetical protein M3Z25_19755, partial [Actinomycetota bacterium]|nr:hypothetical protein [Actinomycetota bacterium]